MHNQDYPEMTIEYSIENSQLILGPHDFLPSQVLALPLVEKIG